MIFSCKNWCFQVGIHNSLFVVKHIANSNHNYALTLLNPSHHVSARSGSTSDNLGISLAAQSMAAAAMHDGQYSRTLPSVHITQSLDINHSIFRIPIFHNTHHQCMHGIRMITLDVRQDGLRGPGNKKPGDTPAWIQLIRKEPDETERCYRSQPPIQNTENQEFHPTDGFGFEYKFCTFNLWANSQ